MLNRIPHSAKILKGAGYILFFNICFIAFFIWLLPVERFVPIAESKLQTALGREVAIGDMSISMLGNLVITDVEISVPEEDSEKKEGEKPSVGKVKPAAGEPKKAQGEKGKADSAAAASKVKVKKAKRKPSYRIEEIVVDVGFIGLMFGDLDLHISADLLGGQLDIVYEGPMKSDEGAEDDASKRKLAIEKVKRRKAAQRKKAKLKARRNRNAGAKNAVAKGADDEENDSASENEGAEESSGNLVLKIEATELNLALIHDLKAALPSQISSLPVKGKIDILVDITSPTGSFADADGIIDVKLSNVIVGNKNSKVELLAGMDPMSIAPIVFSSLKFDTKFAEGLGELTLNTASKDLSVMVEGTVAMAESFSKSQLDVYVMFKILEGYTAKSETAKTIVENMEMFVSQLKRAKRADNGYYGFVYKGPVGKGSFRPNNRYVLKNVKGVPKASRLASKTKKNTSRAGVKKTRRANSKAVGTRKGGVGSSAKPNVTVPAKSNPVERAAEPVIVPPSHEEPVLPPVRPEPLEIEKEEVEKEEKQEEEMEEVEEEKGEAEEEKREAEEEKEEAEEEKEEAEEENEEAEEEKEEAEEEKEEAEEENEEAEEENEEAEEENEEAEEENEE